jgi:cytoskeleton protein RodZ
MAGEAGGEELRGIGARLRSAREKKGLTILQAAEKLHVDARVLESLEREDFAALGAPVYARGHLRRYGELLGEAPTRLQELYDESTHSARPDLTRIPRNVPEGGSRLAAPALLAVVGVALAGLLWWALTTQGRHAQPVTAAVPAVGASAAEQLHTPAAAAPGAAGGDEAVSPVALAPGAATTSGAARLALKFSAPSWVEVYDAGGHRLLHGVEAADSARTLEGTAPLRVVLGNAPGVALQLNGQAVALEGLVHRDKSARVLIDGAGHASAAGPGG